jgi:hypothetical protein
MDETQTQDAVTETTAPVEAPVKARGVYAKKASAWPNATWTWSDGRVDTVDVSALPEDTQHEATLHGVKQKLGDAYSGAKSLTEAQGMFDKALDALKAGWTSRVSGGEADDPVEMLTQAVFAALQDYGKAPEFSTILAKVQAADAAERRKYKQDPKVAYRLAEIKAKSQESPILGLM